MERIGLFVDVQNIYYTTRHAYGRQFDYRTLWSILSRGGVIEVANAYATDRGDEGQRKFQAALQTHRLHGEAQALHSACRRLGQG